MPRAPHLQSYASAAPSRSTVTSYGWISARTPSNRIRRSRRTASGADPAGEELRRELLDERAADLAAHLLAAVRDRERRLEDRLRPGERRPASPRRATARTASGTSSASRSGSAVSPFITARARTRWTSVASASSVGGAGDERIGLDAGVDHRPRVARSVLEPHGRSPTRDEDDLGECRQPVDGAVRVLDPAGSRRSRGRSPARPHRRPSSSPRAGGDLVEARPPRVGQVVDVRPLVLDLLAELGRARA